MCVIDPSNSLVFPCTLDYDWVHEMGALRKVSVKIWDKNDCIDKYKSFPQFPSNSFICAGEQGRESCTVQLFTYNNYLNIL